MFQHAAGRALSVRHGTGLSSTSDPSARPRRTLPPETTNLVHLRSKRLHEGASDHVKSLLCWDACCPACALAREEGLSSSRDSLLRGLTRAVEAVQIIEWVCSGGYCSSHAGSSRGL
jgi:hypothetical protein